MATVDLFQIGQSGTRAYQAAMGAIADNVANTNTVGYSRRNLEVRESAASTAISVFEKAGLSFAGVDIGRVFRASDPYLDLAVRRSGNQLGSAEQRDRWMTDIQTALDDGPLGIGKRMGDMFSAIERLASNPIDTTLRTDVLFSMEQVNTAFTIAHGDMVTVQDGIFSSAENEVTALNDAVKQLATANEGLRRAIEGSPAQVQLLDSRDQALAEITKRIDVNISYDSKGIAFVDYKGAHVVDNITPYAFTVTKNSNGTLSFLLDNISTTMSNGGTIGGLNQSSVIARQRLDDLNALASRYVSDINDWHMAGFTSAGDPGDAILSIGADASTLKLAFSDPSKIAMASGDGTINGNLVAASAIRGTGSMEDGWTQIVSSQGNVASSTKAEAEAASARNSQAEAARSDVSGVNLDREAADLLRLQQAYQGCARVIQVAREITNTIIGLFG